MIAACGRPAAHQGDGVFADLSGKAGPLIRGYAISMPEFDLGEPFKAEYRLSKVPSIGRECGVYLVIPRRAGEFLKDEKHCDGSLRLELTDSRGSTVMSADGRLGDYTWALGGRYELYQLDETFFTPDPAEQYVLRVSYEPDPRLEHMHGHIYLQSGGYK